MIEKWTSIICRFVFGVAFLLIALAVLEWLIRAFWITAFKVYYDPGRLAEFSAIALMFVVALQLREIKILLRGKRSD
jgi:hypothetical protein